jgi:hypothetical protein
MLSVNASAIEQPITRNSSKFLDEQGIIILNSEIQKEIDSIKGAIQQAKDKHSYISINASENPTYVINNPMKIKYIQQWNYIIHFYETNGIGLKVEELIETHYYTNKKDVYKIYNNADIIKLWGENYIPANGQKALYMELKRDAISYIIWTIRGTDDNGNKVEYQYILGLSQFLSTVTAINKPTENKIYDTPNLRYNAKFEIMVSPGVYWVPANSLGGTNFTNDEIAKMLSDNPNTKKNKIDTLYEAIQLYQIGNFKGSDKGANIKKSFNNIKWEYHIPGYDAVRINYGDCSTSSSWLSYILDGDYDEVGIIAFAQLNGSGHLFNYIKQDGYYYFIDMIHYRLDFINSSSIETGQMPDYRKSDIVAGNIHKVANIQDYINYYRETVEDPPELFRLYENVINSPDLANQKSEDGDCILIYPNNSNMKILYNDPKNPISIKFVSQPEFKPDWSTFPVFPIKSVLPFQN